VGKSALQRLLDLIMQRLRLQLTAKAARLGHRPYGGALGDRLQQLETPKAPFSVDCKLLLARALLTRPLHEQRFQLIKFVTALALDSSADLFS
jgi:hypothetical protein